MQKSWAEIAEEEIDELDPDLWEDGPPEPEALYLMHEEFQRRLFEVLGNIEQRIVNSETFEH